MSESPPRPAPGWPGIEARWTSSAKSGVGTAIGNADRVWFTLSHGILNEIYYPRVDQACTRDMGLIVTGPDGYFSEEKRHARHEVQVLGDGIPAYRLVNTALDGRYRTIKEIVTDPRRPVVLQRISFELLQGRRSDHRLFGILAPHLHNAGNDNTALAETFKGTPVLSAQKPGTALAMICSRPWLAASVGFVGVSDGWQQLREHGFLPGQWDIAENGNVALTGEIPLDGDAPIVIAIGFGQTTASAAHHAIASLQGGFDAAAQEYRRRWSAWQRTLSPPVPPEGGGRDLFRTSAAVLMCHESSQFPGAIIASLSIPWGASMGDGDIGGYHLVWPRDLVMSAGALLAAGAHGDVRRVLRYLRVTQEADGRWPQNMWLDGQPYWPGIQLDEAALPVLLVDLARRNSALDDRQLAELWPMVRRAVSFLVQHGPATDQDRWEEDAGLTPFTMAVEVAALLIAAELADRFEPAVAGLLREMADTWNDLVDSRTYVTGTRLSAVHGVDGYYIRVEPLDHGLVTIRNRPEADAYRPAAEVVSPDVLALVRFGLRAADDPRIVNTVKVIDAMLRTTLPAGDCWYRYDGDGYGEHADGAPFDG
ncbi:MAG TPA: glycoside hydrolase family 15 protein, partial [Gemmatimonadales bacterium]|nr:glycoside hydrolase family 15 protein [Gemmatimonadales bacterium]